MPPQSRTQWYKFGPFRLLPQEGRLFRGTKEIKLRPKTFEVLRFLVDHPGSLLTQEEILHGVWRDVHVVADVVLKSISEIRQALDDRTKPPAFIETLYRRGIRFIAPVDVMAYSQPSATVVEPFFGRESELSAITAAATAAFQGSRRALVLVGPAGIGKSRLMQQATRRLAEQGARILYARADNAAGHSPFWVWTQLVQEFAHRVSPDELAACLGNAASDVCLVIPSLQSHLPGCDSPMRLESELARARFFDGIVSFLSNLGAKHPLVLAIDDLHKETSSSLALLQRVMTNRFAENLLIVATSRPPEEATDPIYGELLRDWQRQRDSIETLDLAPLGDEDIRRIVEATTGMELAPDLSRRMVHDSAGNPFFAVEISKWMRERPAAGTDSSTYQIPASIQRIVKERVWRCDDDARTFLHGAAAFGTSFSARVAGQVAGLPRKTLVSVVTSLLRAELVVESRNDHDELSFRHDLIRETIWQSLPAIEKADLHLRIGEALEAASANDDSTVSKLAYHFSRAGSPKALGFCLRAGTIAVDQYSNVEAIELLGTALAIADRQPNTPHEQVFAILEQLARVFASVDRFSEADRCAERMHTLAIAHANPSWRARAALARSARCHLPDRMLRGEEWTGILEQALADLPNDPSLLRGQVAARAAVTSYVRKDGGMRRIELAELTVSIARQQSNLVDRGHLLRDALMAYWDAGHVDVRINLAEELSACARGSRNIYLASEAIAWRALGLLSKGRFKDCDRYALEVEPTILDLRIPAALLYLRRVQFLLSLGRGRLQEAQRYLDSYNEVKSQSALVLNAKEPLEGLLLLVSLVREQGIPADTLVGLRAAADLFPHLPLGSTLAYMLSQAGKLDEARFEFERIAANDFAGLPPNNEAFCWLSTVAAVADTCVELRDRKRAAVLYERLRPYEGLWALVYFAASLFGSVDRPLGRLAALTGDEKRAEDHFQAVIEVCEREDFVTELIRCKLDYASVLAAGARTRAKAAAQLRKDACELARQHALPALLSRAEQSTIASA